MTETSWLTLLLSVHSDPVDFLAYADWLEDRARCHEASEIRFYLTREPADVTHHSYYPAWCWFLSGQYSGWRSCAEDRRECMENIHKAELRGDLFWSLRDRWQGMTSIDGQSKLHKSGVNGALGYKSKEGAKRELLKVILGIKY